MASKEEIKNKLKAKLRKILKIETRIPEKANDIKNGDVSPFFLSLLGMEVTLYGKVAQSINTTFGMSFYEQVSKILGDSVGNTVKLQYKLEGEVNDDTGRYLDTLLESNNYVANRASEIEAIKKLASNGKAITNPDSTVDVFITTPEGVEFYIDITTVKPSKKEFRALKRKLLKWTAMRLSINPDADVRAYIAIPYNPEAGTTPSNEEYSRHSSYYDRKDLLVGNEFWKIVSNNTFDINDMITVFEDLNKEVSKKVTDEIKKHLS